MPRPGSSTFSRLNTPGSPLTNQVCFYFHKSGHLISWLKKKKEQSLSSDSSGKPKEMVSSLAVLDRIGNCYDPFVMTGVVSLSSDSNLLPVNITRITF